MRTQPVVDTAVVIGAGIGGLLAGLPGVTGPPPSGPLWIGRYVRRAQRVARQDPAVAAALLRVSGLLAPPASLLRPAVAARVLTH